MTEAAYVPGEVLLRFKPGTRQADRQAVLSPLDAISLHTFLSGAEHLRLGAGITVEGALAYLRLSPHVEYAEPNGIGSFLTDDVYSSAQWNLPRIQAPDAWVITTGTHNVILAVVDSGIEFNHEDIWDNAWYNPAEAAGSPGVDDDLNGHVDDIRGWDFVSSDNAPTDTDNHGTPIAGIAGAVTNNFTGIAGINWFVRLMPLRVGTRMSGSLTEARVTQAVDYAVTKGAHVINASFQFPVPPDHTTMRNAMATAGDRDILILAAAGNDDKDIDVPGLARDPVSFDLPNIVGVAGSNQSDRKVILVQGNGSAWGPISVDVAAPGEDLCTTHIGNDYFIICVDPAGTEFGGTSGATPHAAGVAALIKSLNLNMPFEIMKRQLTEPSSIDPLSDFNPSTGPYPITTGGRINAHKAVQDFESTAPAQVTDLRVHSRTTTSITLRWTATADDGSNPASGPATLYHVRYSTSPINDSNWLLAKKTTGEPAGPGATETMTVGNLACGTSYHFALKAFDEWGNGPLSNVLSASTRTPLCAATYCRLLSQRCDWTGQCGPGGCCAYVCYYDESCIAEDPPPPNVCP